MTLGIIKKCFAFLLLLALVVSILPIHIHTSADTFAVDMAIAHASEDGVTGCSPLSPNFTKCVRTIVTAVADMFLNFIGLLLGLAGLVFNAAVVETVIEMGQNLDRENVPALTKGWVLFRDLANIAIIFVLLVIGISTILQIEGYGLKQLLPKLIIVAVLINFSLFFTQLIVDASNLLAATFYNQILVEHPKGVANAFKEALDLGTFFNSEGKFVRPESPNTTISQIFLIVALAAVTFFIAAFAFFAAAVLLVMRFSVLVILMVLSPLAFIAMVLPYTSGYARAWWSALINNALFAPVLLILFWFVINIISEPNFRTSIGLNSKSGVSTSSGSTSSEAFAALATSSKGPESIAILLNFMIVIVFLVASLIIAKSLSIRGAGTAIAVGNRMRTFAQSVAGRNTAGRIGYEADALLGKTNFGNTRAGNVIRNMTTRPLAGAKFGGKASYADTEKSMQENIEKAAKSMGDDPVRQARYLKRLSGRFDKRDVSRAYSSLSARDRAAVDEHLQRLDPTLHTTLRSNLTIEDQEKTEDEAKKATKAKRSREIRADIDKIARGQNNPATGATYTAAETASIVSSLPPSQARRLSRDARMDYNVVSNLTVRHLKDLMAEGDLQPDEVRTIRGIVNGPLSYPNQAQHQAYVNDPANRALWS